MPQPWTLVFVAALGGVLHEEPSDAQVDAQLHRRVESIRGGMVNDYLPFNRKGQPVQLQPG